ncbi:MAG: ABC transporter ATP-binding protein [Nitrospirae bacterium]|nr:ABC transporter ATP-binding protein [Nitrospirota bacterium]
MNTSGQTPVQTQTQPQTLTVKDLSVYFRTRHRPQLKVVDSVNFNVESSEVFGVVGESGCGKSITAYSIMGILPESACYSGDIRFQGTDLAALDKEQRRQLRGNRMSIVFQEPMTSLNPVLTVGYQIAESLVTHKAVGWKEAKDTSIALLSKVRIPSAAARYGDYPHQLSGGMRQRAMIAMAIACGPALLIADEPTTALDVTIQAQILALLQKLREDTDMSVMLITHDLGIVAENTDRVAIMYAGRIVEEAGTEELFTLPLHPYTKGLLNSLPKGRGIPLAPIPGVVPRPDNLPPGCKFSDRCSYVIGECRGEEPPLRSLNPGHPVGHPVHNVRCIRAEEI